jgi:hypothetical protein
MLRVDRLLDSHSFRKKKKKERKKERKKGVVLPNLLTKGDTRFRTTSRQLLGSPRTPQFAHLSILLRIDRAIRECMVHDGCLYPAQTFLHSQARTEKKNCMSSTKQKVMASDGNLLSRGSQGSFPLLTKTKCLSREELLRSHLKEGRSTV